MKCKADIGMSRTIETNQAKSRDANPLNEFYYSLKYKERVEFVNEVMSQMPQYKRQIFFNWKGMLSTFPAEAKAIIEDVAGRKIFSNE